MIHPIRGETISSYKKLMNDSATAEIWMTASGKEFGSMCQGDSKTGQKGTNTIMFFVDPTGVPNIPKDRTVSYARVAEDHHPPKEDPNLIQITSGGNLINCPGELTTRTADITKLKLHWNSVLSMQKVKYMCLVINFFAFW
jgi:hypothetical protein